ncbi:MAG: hypothetical protein PHV85_00065 [Desulfovibrionaceae bacterium]|nr:hypothetical protein [Desulfovibrionaceae bacterium]
MAIELSTMEMVLGSGLVGLVSGLAVRLYMGSWFVTQQDFKKICGKQDLQMRMLRAIILSLPIADKDKEKILNDRERA